VLKVKSITNHSFLQSVLGWMAASYILLVYLTSRWDEKGREHANLLTKNGEPYIAAFWHGRLLMAPTGWRKNVPLAVMISKHRDGELISRTVKHFGVTTIRGSTARGGTKALRDALKAIQKGHNIAITPDGPRGPRMRVQNGIILLAKLSGAPIVPATYSVSRRKLLSSWDRFIIALPFSRGIYLWGTPIHIANDANESALEAARIKLEKSMNILTEEADRQMGVELITPERTEN